MRVRVPVVCLGLGLACANPNPSTLNQKCFADENCDEGQTCVKGDGEDAGFCRAEGEVLESSSSSSSGGVGSLSTAVATTMVDPSGSPVSSGGTTEAGTVTTTDETDSGGSSSSDSSGGSTGDPGCAGVPTPDTVSYAAVNTFVVDDNPQGVALGDLDGDGAVDIAVTSYADGTLSTFLGDGFGNFAPAETVGAGSQPAAVELGAIADGTVDAVVEQSLDGDVQRLQGDGAGSFGNVQTAGRTLGAIVLADVNGDDVLDLLGGSGGLTVALGSVVAESFGPVVEHASGLSTGAGEVAVGDFDGNGSLDAVIGGGSFELVVMLGNGAGSFVAEPVRSVSGLVFDVATGDFNADGESDVVAITAGGGTDAQRVFLGNGDGSLANVPEILGTQTTPMAVEVADMDADGDDDIFVAHVGGAVGISTSNGDGSFEPQQVINCDSNLRGVEVADLNDDCVLDVVSVSATSATVCVWLSN